MYRKETIETVKACRFCFMCRHVCTIGNVTRSESNTPRGFGLLTDKSIMRPDAFTDKNFIDTMYECTLCSACRSHCVSSYDVPGFVRAARAEIVAAGNAPDSVRALAKRIIDTGNVFGEKTSRFAKIPSLKRASRADVLLYIGSYAAYRVPEMAEAAIKIFNAAKISFAVIEDEIDTGKALYNLGSIDEAKTAAKHIVQAIRDSGAKTVVTLCPSDYDALKNDYPAFGLSLGEVAVEHSSNFYQRLLKEKKISIKKRRTEKLVFIDSDYLSKYNENGADARAIASAIGDIVEVGTNREESYAALEGGVVYQLIQPKLGTRVIECAASKIAEAGKGIVVTASPISFVTLSGAKDIGPITAIDTLLAQAIS
ncbi:MAG: (Fe-S)-binding protein [Spirochaetota bacterium]